MDRWVVILAVIFGGCGALGFHKDIDALGKTNATVCFRRTAVYGLGTSDVMVAMTHLDNGIVTCSPSGLTVTTTKSRGVDYGPY